MSDSNRSDFDDMQSKPMSLFDALQSFADMLNKINDWCERNADTFLAYINAFVDFGILYTAVEKMRERQIVFTDNLSVEFANKVCNSEDVDATVQEYYYANDEQQINALILRCRQSQKVMAHGSLFSEIEAAYRIGHYQLACIGLFSLIDGIISDISNDGTTKFKKRIDYIKEKFVGKKELSSIDRRLWCIYLSIYTFEDTIFGYSYFAEQEPDSLNRHWLVHGRTHRRYTQYDFLKVLLWLDAMIIFANVSDQEETEEME